MSVTVPTDMRSFLDANHDASDEHPRLGRLSSVEGSPTHVEMATMGERAGVRMPLTPVQQQLQEGILTLLAR